MPWQPAGPGTVAQDAQGAYHVKVAGQWVPAPKGTIAQDDKGTYHYNSDAIATPPLTVTPAPPEPEETTAGDVAKGVGDAAVSGASKVASSIVGAPVALVNRLIAGLSGGDPNEAAAAAHDFVNSHFSRDTQTPVGKKIGAAVQSVLAPVGEAAHATGQLVEHGGEALGIPKADVQNVMGQAGDLAGTAGLVAPILQGAGASSEAASLAAQNAAKATPAAVTKLGMRTGEGQNVAKTLAGHSGQSAVTEHNQAIADPTLGAQAGVKPGAPLTAAALETARGPAESVYSRAEAAIPTGPLSPKAAEMVNGVGADDMIVHSPDTQATVDAQKARLTSGPLTGAQVVNAQRALRFNGFRNVASEDPEQSALGHSQLQMSDALHQHMVDTIPPTADVSPEQLTAARTALAQNHTVDSLLKGQNVDLQALARLHRDNPNMLSGPMKDIAEFADLHPEVTSLPSKGERFNPSGVAKDIASIDLKKPISYLQPLTGTLARRALTGPAVAPSTPVTGLGGEFGPLDRGAPQAPPGMSASTPTAPPPAAPQSGFTLADLLSHGVEHEPAAGLSLGEAPHQEGVPFTRDAAHEAGGLELAPPRTYGGAPANNSDLGHVMSQGVPEGIVQRGGNDPGSLMAASPEAINRGTRHLVEINPDGNERTVMKDVTQIDARAPKGHILLDPSTGEIIDRGGLSENAARGLRNRWATMGRSLGDNFVYGK